MDQTVTLTAIQKKMRLIIAIKMERKFVYQVSTEFSVIQVSKNVYEIALFKLI